MMSRRRTVWRGLCVAAGVDAEGSVEAELLLHAVTMIAVTASAVTRIDRVLIRLFLSYYPRAQFGG